MTKISGQFLISGHFQDNFEISGISGQLGALHSLISYLRRERNVYCQCWIFYILGGEIAAVCFQVCVSSRLNSTTEIHDYIRTRRADDGQVPRFHNLYFISPVFWGRTVLWVEARISVVCRRRRSSVRNRSSCKSILHDWWSTETRQLYITWKQIYFVVFNVHRVWNRLQIKLSQGKWHCSINLLRDCIAFTQSSLNSTGTFCA